MEIMPSQEYREWVYRFTHVPRDKQDFTAVPQNNYPLSRLTEAQNVHVQMSMMPLSSGAIAEMLYIQERTRKVTMQDVYDRLGFIEQRNRRSLIRYLVNNSFLSPLVVAMRAEFEHYFHNEFVNTPAHFSGSFIMYLAQKASGRSLEEVAQISGSAYQTVKNNHSKARSVINPRIHARALTWFPRREQFIAEDIPSDFYTAMLYGTKTGNELIRITKLDALLQ